MGLHPSPLLAGCKKFDQSHSVILTYWFCRPSCLRTRVYPVCAVFGAGHAACLPAFTVQTFEVGPTEADSQYTNVPFEDVKKGRPMDVPQVQGRLFLIF